MLHSRPSNVRDRNSRVLSAGSRQKENRVLGAVSRQKKIMFWARFRDRKLRSGRGFATEKSRSKHGFATEKTRSERGFAAEKIRSGRGFAPGKKVLGAVGIIKCDMDDGGKVWEIRRGKVLQAFWEIREIRRR